MSADTLNISDIREDMLPHSLQAICNVIGLSATIKVVNEYGGGRVWIPNNVQITHPLARLIGLDKATKLCVHYQCEYLPIPRAARAIKAIRNATIVKRYLAGEKITSLARQYGISERMVFYILEAAKCPRRASRQMPLF